MDCKKPLTKTRRISSPSLSETRNGFLHDEKFCIDDFSDTGKDDHQICSHRRASTSIIIDSSIKGNGIESKDGKKSCWSHRLSPNLLKSATDNSNSPPDKSSSLINLSIDKQNAPFPRCNSLNDLGTNKDTTRNYLNQVSSCSSMKNLNINKGNRRNSLRSVSSYNSLKRCNKTNQKNKQGGSKNAEWEAFPRCHSLSDIRTKKGNRRNSLHISSCSSTNNLRRNKGMRRNSHHSISSCNSLNRLQYNQKNNMCGGKKVERGNPIQTLQTDMSKKYEQNISSGTTSARRASSSSLQTDMMKGPIEYSQSYQDLISLIDEKKLELRSRRSLTNTSMMNNLQTSFQERSRSNEDIDLLNFPRCSSTHSPTSGKDFDRSRKHLKKYSSYDSCTNPANKSTKNAEWGKVPRRIESELLRQMLLAPKNTKNKATTTPSKKMNQRGLLRSSSKCKINNDMDDTSNIKSCSGAKMNISCKKNGSTAKKTPSTEIFLQLQITPTPTTNEGRLLSSFFNDSDDSCKNQIKQQPCLVVEGVKGYQRPPLPAPVNSEPTFDTQEQLHHSLPTFRDDWLNNDTKLKCNSSSNSLIMNDEPTMQKKRSSLTVLNILGSTIMS